MFFPGRDDALSHTIKAETAISDLYAEAIRRWAPDVQDAVLPALTAAASELPPDPDAVAQKQSEWETSAEAVIVAGLAVLWAVAVYETVTGLGLPIDIGGGGAAAVSDIDGSVIDILLVSVQQSRAEVNAAVEYVQATPSLAAARDDFLSSKREDIFTSTPKMVRDKVTAALSDPQITVSVIPEDRPAVLQAEAAKVLNPSSAVMREIARGGGYQAAGVMNHAVVAAARQSEDADELEKTWICTIDGKTRPTHWAADGQRVPLMGHFTVGGEQMFVPGDRSASAAEWKNCRCRVGILAVDEELPDEIDRHTERLNGRDSVVINRDGRTQAEEIERRADAGNVRARDDQDGIGRVASGGWAASSEQEYDMAEDAETFLTFSGYIGKLGVATSDRRILAADIDLTMREFPHPMAWQKQASGGHYDSYTVGVVETAEIQGDRVFASGYFLNSTEAMEAADQVKHKVSAPSLDLAAAEYIFTDENGKEIEGDLYDWWEENGEPFTYFTKAEQTGFTLVQTPAFDGIDITLGERETRDLALVASIVARVDGPRVKTYDPALFEDPKLARPTAPTMNNETGRIYGHLAEWGHAIRGGNGELTPRNHNGYANFHTSQVQLDNGKQLSVGRLTVQGGHADTSLGVTLATARAHYDNVCTAFGLVRVGEDRFGIWFSGVPAPGVDPEVFQMGMTAPLSGDWRGTQLDMIAAHAVNSPGFPIYSAVTGPDGRDLALIASLGPSRKAQRAAGGFTMDRESLKTLLTEVVETVDRRRAHQDAALAHKERTDAVLARARNAVGDPPPELTPTQRIGQMLAERA
ncbi:hypothetical protein A5784_14095 [Mycobacterium sp. 852013-50091_SCH5140682]|uniref:hypothetical protein n=1 Tax=Mycobacterium sp. 852013-50091_SCH5140682 TaxID=1834109 RepID=UPI0007E99B91|nr:hypothetical protein [Mycobacterium sp. 852013-50091_SCH5140682]OBC03483.1 hypothetical protein A5784_14095 [Mycobacterium sp. 852013-50091_SCH5140682]